MDHNYLVYNHYERPVLLTESLKLAERLAHEHNGMYFQVTEQKIENLKIREEIEARRKNELRSKTKYKRVKHYNLQEETNMTENYETLMNHMLIKINPNIKRITNGNCIRN